jgi:hypothetical protein
MHTFRLLWEFAANKRLGHAIFGFDREADVNFARLSLGVLAPNCFRSRRA